MRPLQLDNVNWENMLTNPPLSLCVQTVFCLNPERVPEHAVRGNRKPELLVPRGSESSDGRALAELRAVRGTLPRVRLEAHAQALLSLSCAISWSLASLPSCGLGRLRLSH